MEARLVVVFALLLACIEARSPPRPDSVGPGSCPPLPVPKLDPGIAFGCPKIAFRDECKTDFDCNQGTGSIMLCCPFSVIPGCYGGTRCTPAVQIG